MATDMDLVSQMREVVREEIVASENRLMAAIVEQGGLLLDAIEINGQEQNKTAARVDRIEKHLNLPPVK